MTVRELIEKLQAVVDHESMVVIATGPWNGYDDSYPVPGANECDWLEYVFIEPDTFSRSQTPTEEQAVILYPAL